MFLVLVFKFETEYVLKTFSRYCKVVSLSLLGLLTDGFTDEENPIQLIYMLMRLVIVLK